MRQDRGFTLVELMVAVVVLAVLLAIAIPSFTTARTRAQDTAARSDLRSALTAALAARTTTGAWPDAATLAAAEPSLRTTAGPAAVGTISVTATGTVFAAAALSASGACHRLLADATGVPTWTQDRTPCWATTGAAWTPAALGAGVALWLDASDTGSLLLNGGAVLQWNDRSPHGRHVAQSNPARRPTAVANAVNGLAVLRLDASSTTHLTRTNHGLPTGSSPWTWFLVSRGGTPRGEVFGWGDNGTGRFGFWLENDGRMGLEVLGSAYVGTPFSAGPSLVSGSYSGGGPVSSYRQWWNGTPDTMSLVGIDRTPSATATELRIGGVPTTVSHMVSMDVGEIIVVPGPPSTEVRQQVEGYLAWKWGLDASLPAGHPFATAAP